MRIQASRRTFLRTAAAAGLAGGLVDAPWTGSLRRVSADEASPQPSTVQLRPEIEPLVKLLEDARNRHEFGSLVIIAPPLMLGALRGHLTTGLQRCVESELDKELLHSAVAEILEYVQQAVKKPSTS